MRKNQLMIAPMLLSASLLLAQAPGQQSMGQQQQYGSQMRHGLPSTNQAQPVQQSVPFGVVNGRLVTSGDNLIFIDDQQPQNSYVISRNDIREVNYDGSMVTLVLSRPIRDSAGERSVLNYRFQNTAGPGMISSWLGPSAGATAQAVQPYSGTPQAQYGAQTTDGAIQQAPQQQQPPVQMAQPRATTPQTQVFDVERERFAWRADHGRLFITPTEIIFQSIDNPGASRRWTLSEIRRVDRKDPFHLRVDPYVGNEFNFKILSGSGLSTQDYALLTNRVAMAQMQREGVVQTDGAAAAGAPGTKR